MGTPRPNKSSPTLNFRATDTVVISGTSAPKAGNKCPERDTAKLPDKIQSFRRCSYPRCPQCKFWTRAAEDIPPLHSPHLPRLRLILLQSPVPPRAGHLSSHRGDEGGKWHSGPHTSPRCRFPATDTRI